MLVLQRRFGEAEEAFEEAIAIDPEYELAEKALRDVREARKLERMIRNYDGL